MHRALIYDASAKLNYKGIEEGGKGEGVKGKGQEGKRVSSDVI
jgi:hypothetical protein